ncbi:hypothetical protein TNCV_3662111 [Trichonephila clavipes]|nr:hypothetical protein TNCV_3662111 [Trichonephila clavipes]
MGGHEPGYGLLLARLRRRIVNVSCLSSLFPRVSRLRSVVQPVCSTELKWRVIRQTNGYRALFEKVSPCIVFVLGMKGLVELNVLYDDLDNGFRSLQSS